MRDETTHEPVPEPEPVPKPALPPGVEPLFDALLTPTSKAAPMHEWTGGGASSVPASAIALGVDQHLDPRHVAVERIGLALLTAIVSGVGLVAGVIVALTTEPGPLWLGVIAGAWIVLTALLLFAVARWPQVAHRHASYRVDADGIEIRRGVWWRSVVSVPRSRVQHIDVTQGPIDRRHGLGALVLHTAGNEYAQVPLEGLDHGVALELRDHLLPRGGDDAV